MYNMESSVIDILQFLRVQCLCVSDLNIYVGPVTIADQMAEEAMVSILFQNFPNHAM